MAGVLTMAALAATACARAGAVPAPAAADPVARGQYLVNMMGCNDCHTPLKMGENGPEPDLARFLSGHPEQIGAMTPAQLAGGWAWAGSLSNTAFSGPWGISYAANLTPDQNTGLGIWTEEMFVNAIRAGKHMGTSRPILPPMPWPAFRNASDEDLKAIYAYLRTIAPISNHVPDAQPAGPPAVSTTN
jgi:mono/diheme cytochrome c family protein